MAGFWGRWRRWRRYIQRRVDMTGLVFLTVAILTIGIYFLAHTNSLLLCLLLLLPIALLATFQGWTAGLLGGVVAALLTAPREAHAALITPPLDIDIWVLLSLCYLVFGVLLGLQGVSLRGRRKLMAEEIEAKLEHARVSAERYEAIIEEMSEGQEFLARMNEELAILNTIATAVNGSLDVRQVQGTAMTHISTLLNVDEVQIYWIGEEGDSFVLQAAQPLSDDEVAQAPPVPLDEGVLGQLVTNQHAARISETTGDLDTRPPMMSDEVKSIIAIPLRTRSRLFGALLLGRNSGRSFSEDDEKFLGSVGRVLALAIENAKLFKQTQELSLADELTGLANRRMFNLHLAAEINHARVTGAQLCLIFFDLNRLKPINDTYGHLVGDAVLRWFAKTVQEDIRGSDLFCRYGGDEFALVAPDIAPADAASLAGRICRHIEQTPFQHGAGAGIAVTVCAGVAALGPGIAAPDTLIDAADQALYLAKGSGGTRVEVFSPVTLIEA